MTKRKRIALTAVVLIAVAGLLVWRHMGSAEDTKKSDKPQGPVPVRMIDAQPRDIPVYLKGIGNVAAEQAVVVRAQIDGQLVAVHFKEGQEVKQGDLLAEIDPRAIQANLLKSQADRASAVAQLHTAQLDLTRYKNLLKDDAIARQKVDQQAALVEQLRAGVQVSEAEIESDKVQISYTRILSPLTGVVGLRTVDAGNIVKASDANGIVTVAQVDPISVLFTLPQEDVQRLQELLRQNATIPVDIFPKEGDAKIASGTIAVIDNTINSATGTIRIKAEISNVEHVLWPGEFVVARIAANVLQGKIVLPLNAVQAGQDKYFVWRIKGDTAEAVDVKITYQDDAVAVIESGLNPGDKIVTDGQARLKPDSKVQIGDGKPKDDVATPNKKDKKSNDKKDKTQAKS